MVQSPGGKDEKDGFVLVSSDKSSPSKSGKDYDGDVDMENVSATPPEQRPLPPPPPAKRMSYVDDSTMMFGELKPPLVKRDPY